MSRSQLIVLIVVVLWMAVVTGFVLFALGPEGATVLTVRQSGLAIVTLIALVPPTIGGVLWLWLGNRSLQVKRYAPMVAAPWVVVAVVLTAFRGNSKAQDEEHERCRWVSAELSDIDAAIAGFDVTSLSVSRRPYGIETTLGIEGTVRNVGESSARAEQYFVRYVAPDGTVVGEFRARMPEEVRRRVLRNGYTLDLILGAGDVPSLARSDTAELHILFCNAS